MIVAFLNQKGGVGNTTLSLPVAGAWPMGGKRVVIIDADPQGSALNCSEQRARGGLPRLFGALGLARDTLHVEAPPIARGVHHILIDRLPRIAPLMRLAMLAADLVVVPVQPSPLDRWASGEIPRLLQKARIFCPRLVARFALNACGARTVIARETAKALTRHEPPVLAARVGQRVVFAEAAHACRLVSEVSRSNLAVHEIDTPAEIERVAR